MKRKDAYGLPGRIKVKLIVDAFGCLVIRPVSERARRAVGRSNAYNGDCDVFDQSPHDGDKLREWQDTLPKRAFYGRGKKRDFNDGVVFMIDSWTFRHLVGGQSD